MSYKHVTAAGLIDSPIKGTHKSEKCCKLI